MPSKENGWFKEYLKIQMDTLKTLSENQKEMTELLIEIKTMIESKILTEKYIRWIVLTLLGTIIFLVTGKVLYQWW